MIIAVASDAHGARGRMNALLRALPKLDAFCFLGDMDKDAEYLDWGLREHCPGAAFHAVAGNNDPFSQRPGTLMLPFEGVQTLLTHGHRFSGIRISRQTLFAFAKQQGCALALYGHTHVKKEEEQDGVRAVNPGALNRGEWALVTITGAEAHIDLRTL